MVLGYDISVPWESWAATCVIIIYFLSFKNTWIGLYLNIVGNNEKEKNLTIHDSLPTFHDNLPRKQSNYNN